MAARPRPSAAPLATDAGQLCLPGAQSNGRLCRRPMLQGAHAPDAHPSARGAPSTQAPGKVRVRIHAEGNPFALPREV
eukprot:2074785-Alexandrium_andersonii.AAC.1